MSSPDALMQCKKCGAVMSVDLVDAITAKLDYIHKDPDDPRFKDAPCGGKMKLYQEVRY
jgi:hypothetical protein